jgi:hypothetical protein
MSVHKKVRNATAEELVEMVFNGEVSLSALHDAVDCMWVDWDTGCKAFELYYAQSKYRDSSKVMHTDEQKLIDK